MRILHLDSGSQMRGGQWQALRLMEGLRAAGHDNVLLARTGSPLADEAGRCGIEVQHLSLLRLPRWSRDVEIVHAHDARTHTMAALAGTRRLVVSRRVGFPVKRNSASRWKYRRAAHYIAVSEFVKGQMLEAGVPAGKISVVYDGVPLGPVARGTEILAPATEDPRKGTDLALQAAKRAGFSARLSHDLESDLMQAGLFVYITHSEGLGSAVLLAMAAGVPVIASQVGGLPEIVEHEHTGLLTENSIQDIADAIRRVMADRQFAESLGRCARARVEQKFSAARMVAATAAVYEALR